MTPGPSFSRLEARLKKSKADDKTSASESQALSAMVRALGLERGGNESGVVAIEKALQAAALEREAMKKELEQKREEVEVMARRLRDISHKNAKVRPGTGSQGKRQGALQSGYFRVQLLDLVSRKKGGCQKVLLSEKYKEGDSNQTEGTAGMSCADSVLVGGAGVI